MAHSCSHCQKLVIAQPTVYKGLSGEWVDVVVLDGSHVLRAASEGCAFFDWCLGILAKNKRDDLQDSGDGISLRVAMWSTTDQDIDKAKFVVIRWDDQDGYRLADRDLYILAEEGDSAARYYLERPVRKSVASAANFDQVATWLSQCVRSHDACRISKSYMTPLRLLKISWENETLAPRLQLVNCPGPVKYAALSYCWGGDQSTKTTSVTLETRIDDIPFSTLSQTLKDAIVTTWKIGLHFLWVDCLCILQDSEVDKATEISKMPQTYQGAYVTISAARSAGSHEGFLQDIRVPSVNANVFKLAYACPDGMLGSILLFREPNNNFGDPINERAWTLQEYLLSRRVLIYGLYGFHWSCLCREEYDEQATATASLNSHLDQRLTSLRTLPIDVDKARYQWDEVVNNYTDRTLSEDADRSLAISGIAELYSNILDDEYLAGIWLGDLPAGLMWERKSWPKPRPQEYRAPTWSWIAIDGSVEHYRNYIQRDPDLEIISHSIQPKHKAAPFGAIISGQLILRGLLRRIRWDGERLYPLCGPIIADEAYMASTLPDTIEDDTHVDEGDVRVVWCLQICPFREEEDLGPSGLILTSVDAKCFERRGIFEYAHLRLEQRTKESYKRREIEQRGWRSQCELSEITLI